MHCNKDFLRCSIEALKGSDPMRALKTHKICRINESLLHILLNNIVPDELHLLLRITDILTSNIISTALQRDIQNSRSVWDVLNRPMMTNLLKAIRSCGVCFNINTLLRRMDLISLHWLRMTKRNYWISYSVNFVHVNPQCVYSQVVTQILEVCSYICTLWLAINLT